MLWILPFTIAIFALCFGLQSLLQVMRALRFRFVLRRRCTFKTTGCVVGIVERWDFHARTPKVWYHVQYRYLAKDEYRNHVSYEQFNANIKERFHTGDVVELRYDRSNPRCVFVPSEPLHEAHRHDIIIASLTITVSAILLIMTVYLSFWPR